jgi:hypothetical protein
MPPPHAQFWSGEFSQMISTNVIGVVLCFVGVGEVVGGIAFGRLSDKMGRSASIGLGAVCYSIGLGLTCYMKASGWMPGTILAGAPLVAYIAGFLFGLGDSAFNANCYAICAQLYQDGPVEVTSRGATDLEDAIGDGHGYDGVASGKRKGRTTSDASPLLDGHAEGGSAPAVPSAGESVDGATHSVGAFTIFQLVQNIGSAVGFFYALPLPMHDPDPASGQYGEYTQAYVQFAVLAVSTVTFIICDRIHVAKGKAGQ